MIHSVINQSPYDSFIKWRMLECCNYKCSYCGRSKMARFRAEPIHAAQYRCMEDAVEISRICDELPGKVQLDLVGGEVTLLNLELILDQIKSSKVYNVCITTNFSQPLSYYIGLVDYLSGRNISLTLTASYHAEHVNTFQFLEKARAFMEVKGPKTVFKVETVSTLYNQDRVRLFQKECEKRGLPYMIDRDFRCPDQSLVCTTSKDKPVRYHIIHDNGFVEPYRSRSEFLHDYGIFNQLQCLNTRGMYCSRDYNFVYIDNSQVMGHSSLYSHCKERVPLAQYHPLTEPAQCRNTACSICGRMSLSRDQQSLIEALKPEEV